MYFGTFVIHYYPVKNEKGLIKGVIKFADFYYEERLSDPSGIAAYRPAETLRTGPNSDKDGEEHNNFH